MCQAFAEFLTDIRLSGAYQTPITSLAKESHYQQIPGGRKENLKYYPDLLGIRSFLSMANVFDKFLRQSFKLLQYFSLSLREKLGKLFSAREFIL